MSKYSSTCYYSNYYTSHLGDSHSDVEFDISEMDELHDRYLVDNTYPELGDEINHIGVNYEVLTEWAEIRRSLETVGIWGDIWEQGSHAISMTNLNDAEGRVREIETQIFADEF